MSESPEASAKPEAPSPKQRGVGWVIGGVALVGAAAAVYIIGSASTKPTPPAPSAVATASTFASKLTTPTAPTASPDYTFYDAEGKAMKIADLKGKVVVMNIWATWCGPCVTEMPTLAKLQAAYAGKPVEVVTVSIDSESSAAKARIFIAQHAPLKFYHDREMKLPFKLSPPAPGAPTTVIYGKDGLEVARVAGEADWSGKEARAIVDKALAG
ncbi:MAG: TlpA family protein disulfide reductase [Alphaproteobacteria bacterium]|nr:TlpA family protein disulfide reductase [Alphaproteobacteria bacterium]MBU1516036.1 TlpA family protein disulfide reductase [Alphaproteobacteria bacterium]MBU2092749.1 TlpA family protein disulfide reductase [Alphaproteobacteria bacterium]MBU2153726.1 TlpA family protein disulfide reductase [Alphaproteobacteria bacterium]MBU2308354.1 TlpA family protein disulfide reductase [Alphaproteobacteria bacterium]